MNDELDKSFESIKLLKPLHEECDHDKHTRGESMTMENEEGEGFVNTALV